MLVCLESKGRVVLGTSCLDWLEKSFSTGLQPLPITPKIAVESCQLPGDLHSDPADRIIVATARIENLILITRDSGILEYGKKKHLNTFAA